VDQEHVVELANSVAPDLGSQIEFLLEIDKLKNVIRRSKITDGSRLENTAEHSWHLAMLAIVLAPHAASDVDICRALKLLLVHDLVEIDAGDTFAYDVAGHEDKVEREQQAADRIFAILPPQQRDEIRSLWDEYEARETPTAVFAYACDRLEPMLLNASNGGGAWKEHGVKESQVRAYNGPIEDASDPLWALADRIINSGVAIGALS